MQQPSTSLRAPKAAALLGIAVPTLWRWTKNRPDFPKPIKLSARVTVWDAAQLESWRTAQGDKGRA